MGRRPSSLRQSELGLLYLPLRSNLDALVPSRDTFSLEISVDDSHTSMSVLSGNTLGR